MNGMCDIGVHDDSLVGRPVVGLRSVWTFHRHVQRHTTLDGEVTVRDLAGKVSSPPVTQFRQESHVASVDTEKGDVQCTRTRRGNEERPVAAD